MEKSCPYLAAISGISYKTELVGMFPVVTLLGDGLVGLLPVDLFIGLARRAKTSFEQADKPVGKSAMLNP